MSAAAAEKWWAHGRTLDVTIGGARRRVFVREDGSGPCLTLLHGYPASSLEWAGVWALLSKTHRVIALDFLGYGASDKPARYAYPLDDQADLVQEVWRSLGVTNSAVVAYDYGAIITQILVARQAPITSITYLNASLYPELYRPRLIQRLAPVPMLGAAIWKGFNEATFYRTWATVFSPEHPLDHSVAREHWKALTHGDPRATASRAVLSYMRQRARRADELAATLTQPVPTRFLWGGADPVSGPAIADALRARLDAPDLTEYPNVGHAPHLEIPDVIAAAITAS